MKTKILMLIICACSMFNIQAQEWGYVNTLTDEYLRKIWTQGLETVYIVGENGLIARSIDQGGTWDKQYPTEANLNDIIFIDDYTGFAAGEQGSILKTTDAGETWEQITLEVTFHINAIAATGLDNIWVVGDNSMVLYSIDAGETWEQKNILPENDRQLSDIAFRGNLGYFTGNYATVYKTEDYGVTWDKQILTEQETGTFYAVNIMENKTYMLYDTMSGCRFFFTENQIHWNNDNWGDADIGRNGLFFLNDNQGYRSFSYYGGVVGNSDENNNGYMPAIMTTNQGGQDWSWHYIDIDWRSINQGQYPINPLYIDIRAVNSTLGYAIFGQSLLKFPKQIGQGINNLDGKNVLELSQLSENELLIKSQFNPITSIEIFDISGKLFFNQKWQYPLTETIVSVGNLSKGIYLIRTTHNDNMVLINKYIKQ